MKYIGSIGLGLALAVAGAASACGPATPEGQTPGNGTAAATASAAPTETASAAPTQSASAPAPTQSATAPATAAPTASSAPAAAGPAGPPVMATKLAEDLKKAGFDLAKMPPSIEKMPDAQKKKLMPVFVKALGYEDCKGCHAEGDFKKRTRNTNIAKGMYDHFVAGLRDEKGAATIFCDSCHQGKPKVLNRSDKKAVGKFMDDQYVNHLARADKKSQECGTCHGDTMEMAIFDKMWKVNP
jgi:hypothetical protein